MSGSLWYQLPRDKRDVSCGPGVRDAIGNRGELRSSDVPFLEGMAAIACSEDARAINDLIEIIQEHGFVHVGIDY